MMTVIRTAGHGATVQIQSLLLWRLPYLKSPDAATAVARTPSQSPAISSTYRILALFSRNISFKGKAMPAVHYYLGRPARVWISAHSRRSPARQARTGGGDAHGDIPGRPARGFTPSASTVAHGSADACSRGSRNQKSPVTASGLPPDAPAGGLLARHRIAIARFGTDVAAAGGIGPALAAGLDPADYPVVPGGVPQAWERAQVYLGLCERYQELYQKQVAELHLLMAVVPGSSLPLPHRRPLTDLPNGHPHSLKITHQVAPRTAQADSDNPHRTADLAR
jgi:hypothetical protein